MIHSTTPGWGLLINAALAATPQPEGHHPDPLPQTYPDARRAKYARFRALATGLRERHDLRHDLLLERVFHLAAEMHIERLEARLQEAWAEIRALKLGARP